MSDIDRILSAAPVIPVLVIERTEDAVPIAEALVEGGLPVLEVTLRTPGALDAITAIKQVRGAIVGAGTVLNADQYDAACGAGAEFVVSPGLTPDLAEAAANSRVPHLPGVATASEIMRALGFGYSRLKFFPATAGGGPPALQALSAVFRDVRFCPTGGISFETAPEWFAISSVVCIGGSWIVPAGQRDPRGVVERARQAASLRPSE